ncbi:MAG: DNA/RNA nuclease SfsA [Chloroflexi bacterium]|nr:DNA/RNA nuclease SfsA [Chloroflexota bacterium]
MGTPVRQSPLARVSPAAYWRRGFFSTLLDFWGHGPARDCLVEVKSVTLARRGHGYFPDAVTARGARHVRELTAARAADHDAAVLFIAQRDDVDAISPEDDIDPAFGVALRAAERAGVRLLAYTCQIALDHIALGHPVPVILPEPG